MKVKLLASSLVTSLSLLFVSPAAMAAFDPLGAACSGTGTSSNSPACQQDKNQTSNTNPVVDRIQTAANIIALIAGISGVIIIIYSGFVFATAGGGITGQRAGDNQARSKQARATLTGAVIGLVIVALAWAIVTFVTDRFVQ